MANDLVVTVSGLNRLLARVTDVNLDKATKKRIADAVGANLLHRQRERFLRAVDPDENPWPVSFAALQRQIQRRGGLTLFDTGRLFHSIQYALVDENTGVIGTDVPYAADHQFGLKGLPVRKFLGINPNDAKAAELIAGKVMSDILAGKDG